MGTAHHLHVISPRGVVPPRSVAPLVLHVLPVLPVETPHVSGLTALGPVLPQQRSAKETETTSPRCGERGCIFPPLQGGDGKCIHHRREDREPSMYLSKQPTQAAIEYGKFVRLDEDLTFFGSREADRRRLDAEREAFFET